MKRFDFVLSGYSGINQILRVRTLPRVGVTELVQNSDCSKLFYGGNAVNIAYCMARLGCSALPVIRGGEDFEATGFGAALREAEVCCEAVTIVEGANTPYCYLVEDDAKNHLTLFYPGAMDGKYAPETLPDNYFDEAAMAVLAVGSRQDNALFLKKTREKGLPLVFGMRADFDAFPKELLWEILTEAVIIFTNEEERRLIEELYGLKSITELFGRGKAHTIITTLGKDGSTVYENTPNGAKGTNVPATQGGAVVDATGAGDSYIAGYLYGLRGGRTPAECAALGSTMASFIIETVGCLTNVPGEDALLKRNGTRNEDNRGADIDG